jgi:hypothetical protein
MSDMTDIIPTRKQVEEALRNVGSIEISSESPFEVTIANVLVAAGLVSPGVPALEESAATPKAIVIMENPKGETLVMTLLNPSIETRQLDTVFAQVPQTALVGRMFQMAGWDPHNPVRTKTAEGVYDEASIQYAENHPPAARAGHEEVLAFIEDRHTAAIAEVYEAGAREGLKGVQFRDPRTEAEIRYQALRDAEMALHEAERELPEGKQAKGFVKALRALYTVKLEAQKAVEKARGQR